MRNNSLDPRGSFTRQREHASALAKLHPARRDPVASVLELRAKRELARRIRERSA